MDINKVSIGWRMAIISIGMVAIVEGVLLMSASGGFGAPWTEIQFTDQFSRISVLGSWVSDSDDGIVSEFPLNTIELVCTMDVGRCYEARAFRVASSEHTLAQLLEYEITDWSDNAVFAVLDGLVSRIEIHIDRVGRTVTMNEIEKGQSSLLYSHLEGGR